MAESVQLVAILQPPLSGLLGLVPQLQWRCVEGVHVGACAPGEIGCHCGCWQCLRAVAACLLPPFPTTATAACPHHRHHCWLPAGSPFSLLPGPCCQHHHCHRHLWAVAMPVQPLEAQGIHAQSPTLCYATISSKCCVGGFTVILNTPHKAKIQQVLKLLICVVVGTTGSGRCRR